MNVPEAQKHQTPMRESPDVLPWKFGCLVQRNLVGLSTEIALCLENEDEKAFDVLILIRPY